MSHVSRAVSAADWIDNDLAVLWSKLADLDNLAVLLLTLLADLTDWKTFFYRTYTYAFLHLADLKLS